MSHVQLLVVRQQLDEGRARSGAEKSGNVIVFSIQIEHLLQIFKIAENVHPENVGLRDLHAGISRRFRTVTLLQAIQLVVEQSNLNIEANFQTFFSVSFE